MAITLDGSLGITTPTYGGADTAEYLVPVTQFKNRIINGAMMIDQRNAGASVTPTSNATYTLDRWRASLSQASKYSVQQNAGSVTPPAGFTNYLGITSTSSYSVGASDFFIMQHDIEGYNIADLGWGTANAKTVTLSFWVRSSLTGTFGGSMYNSAGNPSYAFTYTISSANTWEQKSITVVGPSTGTFATNNTSGLQINFGLGVGSTFSGTAGAWTAATYFSATGATSVVGTNGATFYITGVQLEVGSTATSFDYRPYGTELALCQRYTYVYSALNAFNSQSGGYARAPIFGNGTNTSLWYPQYPVQMRACPSLTTNISFGNATSLEGYNYSTGAPTGFISSVTLAEGSVWAGQVGLNFASGISSGNIVSFRWTGASSSNFIFNAEL